MLLVSRVCTRLAVLLFIVANAKLWVEAIRRKTEHLLTTLSEQLMAIYSDTLECIPLANISEPSGKSYQSLVKALQTSILSEYGSPMPLGLVKEFQGNCKAWDQEFRTLLEEYNVVQQELMDLAKEIGVHSGDNAGKVVGEGVDMDSETEFGEMVEELKQTTKTWTTKMEKLENVCSSFLIHVRTFVHAV